MTMPEDPTLTPGNSLEPLLTPHPPTPTTTPYLSLPCGHSSSKPPSEVDLEEEREFTQKAAAADCFGPGFLDSDTEDEEEATDPNVQQPTQTPQAPEARRTSCHDAYLEFGNCKPMMLAICCGVMNGKRKIAEMDEEPYATLLKKVKLKHKVNKKHYIEEVECCCLQKGIRVNKCSNKLKQAVKEELYKMPITEQADIDWLKEEEGKFL
jgi:hypothetical protein